MGRLNVGVIGVGFIGISHVDAIRRVSNLNLIAVADSNVELAKQKAQEYNIPKCYDSIDELMADNSIDVIHNCTPNNLHFEVNIKAIKAGKHVFSEKPLTMDVKESSELLAILKQHPNVVAGVNYCYRMNPLVQDAKNRITNGEIGKPLFIHGSYLQDWLLYDTDYNWRIDPEYTGISRAIGDIGTHWLDLAQTMTSAKIIDVCANTVIVHPKRKKPNNVTETFAVNDDDDYTEVNIVTEDYCGALLKFDNGASGVFQCSQASAGRKCFIDIEVDGTEASYQWNHEHGDRMWKGLRNANNEEIMRNPNLMTPEAAQYTYLAAGHPEGWNDAFTYNLKAYYDFLMSGKKHGDSTEDFATFDDAHYLMCLTEALLKSAREERWVSVDEVEFK